MNRPDVENIDIHLHDETTKELVIRYGEALPVQPPEPFRVMGVIFAPGDYIERRKDLLDHTKVNVVCNRDKGHITLTINEHDVYHDTIEGILLVNPALWDFQINANSTYNTRELINKLRFKRSYFTSREEHAKLMDALNKLVLKGEVNVNQSQDNRGNKVAHKDTSLVTNIPASFMLHLPIYKGCPESKFQVDVCLDYTDSGTKLWLESVELEELKITLKDKVIDKELERLKDYVIINI